MVSIRIPGDVLAAELRAGRVTVGGLGGSAAMGALGHVASAIAAHGLKKAGEAGQDVAGLRFPPCCCNCLATGNRVRPIESVSVVNRGVAYTFRLQIPHCARCADTASRKRPGAMGMLAAFLAVSVPVMIVLLGFGLANNKDGLVGSSFVVGPAAGVAVPLLWSRRRRPLPGQASAYQPTYASAIEVDFSGVPKSFTLTFENASYADRFVALNKELGVAIA